MQPSLALLTMLSGVSLIATLAFTIFRQHPSSFSLPARRPRIMKSGSCSNSARARTCSRSRQPSPCRAVSSRGTSRGQRSGRGLSTLSGASISTLCTPLSFSGVKYLPGDLPLNFQLSCLIARSSQRLFFLLSQLLCLPATQPPCGSCFLATRPATQPPCGLWFI